MEFSLISCINKNNKQELNYRILNKGAKFKLYERNFIKNCKILANYLVGTCPHELLDRLYKNFSKKNTGSIYLENCIKKYIEERKKNFNFIIKPFYNEIYNYILIDYEKSIVNYYNSALRFDFHSKYQVESDEEFMKKFNETYKNEILNNGETFNCISFGRGRYKNLWNNVLYNLYKCKYFSLIQGAINNDADINVIFHHGDQENCIPHISEIMCYIHSRNLYLDHNFLNVICKYISKERIQREFLNYVKKSNLDKNIQDKCIKFVMKN